jgi:hypothetical protein
MGGKWNWVPGFMYLCPGVFLHLATVAESVITDFKIFKMCTSRKDKQFMKMGCQGNEMSK